MLNGFVRMEADETFPIRNFFGKVSCPHLRCRLACRTAEGGALNIIFGKVGAMSPPPKAPNAGPRRSREHLTPAEIDRLIAAAQRLGRHGHRDATMILLAYRHGLRVRNWSACGANSWICGRGCCMSAAARTGCPAPIPCADRNSGPYERCCGITRKTPMSSSPSVVRR